MAVAFGFKLWWRLLAQDSLWAQFLPRSTVSFLVTCIHLHVGCMIVLLGVVFVVSGLSCMIIVGPWVRGKSASGMMSGLGLVDKANFMHRLWG